MKFMKHPEERKIIETVNVRQKKEGLLLLLSFLYSINNRIFRISKLFTEQRNDKNRSKFSFSYIIST